MTVQISCLHARGISDLPMGNVPGLQTYRYVGIARDRAHTNVDCVQSMHMSADIVSVHHSVTTHSW